jgi:DNA-binding MarR family transcriptional regulator
MSAQKELSQADYQVLAECRYLLRRFLHFSEQQAREAGLEPQQHQMLLAIRALGLNKPASVGELAERMQLQHHSTVELINRMEERGLLERRRDTDDQRRVLIYLTPYGEELLKNLSIAHRTELRTTAPALLKALRALIENLDIDGDPEQ